MDAGPTLAQCTPGIVAMLAQHCLNISPAFIQLWPSILPMLGRHCRNVGPELF